MTFTLCVNGLTFKYMHFYILLNVDYHFTKNDNLQGTRKLKVIWQNLI